MSPAVASPLSLVIAWDAAVGHAAALQFHRTLAKLRLPATWTVATDRQAQALRAEGAAVGGAEIALSLRATPALSTTEWTRRLKTELAALRAAGTAVSTVHLDGAVMEHARQRALAALGVGVVVVDAAANSASAVRQLPFGIWQLSPRQAAPALRGWRSWFRAQELPLVAAHGSATILVVDVAGVAARGRSGWRQFDGLAARIAEAQNRGEVAVAAATQLAARLSAVSAVRPQRSILRAAA